MIPGFSIKKLPLKVAFFKTFSRFSMTFIVFWSPSIGGVGMFARFIEVTLGSIFGKRQVLRHGFTILGSDFSKDYGLYPGWYRKTKRWAVDQDYVEKLSPREKAWLDRFNREYHAGDLRKGDPENIHSTDELRKDCYRRNNWQNRDLFSQKNAIGMVSGDVEQIGVENDLVEKIDRIKTPKASPLTLYAVSFALAYMRALSCLSEHLRKRDARNA